MREITPAFVAWLEQGPAQIGQILIRPLAHGWDVRHVDDANRTDLVEHGAPEAARHLANLNAEGKFRPLKTTRDLPGGWRLILPDAAAVRRALDFFYPAMTGVWHSHQQGTLPVVTLRETLGRQTGMYRVTQKLTDEQSRELVDRFCAACMKQRLWEIAGPNPAAPVFGARVFPLLCHEACNLLVAEARSVVKAAS